MKELLDHLKKSSHVLEAALAVLSIFRHDGFGSKSVLEESFLIGGDREVASLPIWAQSVPIFAAIVAAMIASRSEVIASRSEMTSSRRLMIPRRRVMNPSRDQRTPRDPLELGRGREMAGANRLGDRRGRLRTG